MTTASKPVVLLTAAALSALLCGPARAAGDTYGDGLAAYKGELKRDAPDVMNSDFYGTVANSQARRALGGIDSSTETGDVAVTASHNPSSKPVNPDPRNPGGVNVASPQIYGRVHGNVVVVVQRGAVRGSITSVQH